MIEDHIQEVRFPYHPYKSRPEHRIAGLLDRYGLPFIYEKPTAVVDSGKVRIWYPDFTLSYGPVIEYFGVGGDEAYRQRTQHKLAIYQQNQIPVLAMYPENLSVGWEDHLLRRIDGAIERQLQAYRSRVQCRYTPVPHSHALRYRAH